MISIYSHSHTKFPSLFQKLFSIYMHFQFILISLETFIIQKDGNLNGMETFFSAINSAVNFSSIKFQHDQMFSDLRFVAISACILTTLIIYFANFSIKNRHKNIQLNKLLFYFQNIHLNAMWLPIYNYGLFLAIQGDKYEKPEGIIVGVIVIMINFALLSITLRYHLNLWKKESFSRASNHYILIKLFQAILISGWNCFDSQNGHSRTMSLLKVLISILLEIVGKIILSKTVPFSNFKLNLLASKLQTLSLSLLLMSLVLNVNLDDALSYKYQIFVGSFLVWPFISKSEDFLFKRELLYIEKSLKKTNGSNENPSWTLHRLNFILKKLLSKNQQKNEIALKCGFYKSILLIESENESIEKGVDENFEISRRFISNIREYIQNSAQPEVHLFWAELAINHKIYLFEALNILQEVLQSKNTSFSLKITAKLLQNSVSELIRSKYHENKSEIKMQHLIDCHDTNNTLIEKISSHIDKTKSFMKYFSIAKPNLNDMIDALGKLREEEAEIESFWNSQCLPKVKEYPNMLLQYYLYNNLIKPNEKDSTKYLTEYEKVCSRHENRFKAEILNHESIFSPENIIIHLEITGKNVGNIQYTSSNIHESLGYKADDIVGKKLDLLLLPYLSGIHEKIFAKKLYSIETIVDNKTNSGYVKDREGYIQKVQYMTLFMSNMDHGMSYAGIIKPIMDVSKTIVINSKGMVEGYTKEFAMSFLPKGKNANSLSDLGKSFRNVVRNILSLTNTNSDTIPSRRSGQNESVLGKKNSQTFQAKLDLTSESNQSQAYNCEYEIINFNPTYSVIQLSVLDETVRSNNILRRPTDESNEISYCEEHQDEMNQNIFNRTEGRLSGSLSYENEEKRLNSKILKVKRFEEDKKSNSRASTKSRGHNRKLGLSFILNHYSKLYSSSDLTRTFLIMGFPFVLLIVCLIVLYAESSSGISNIRNMLDMNYLMIQFDRAFINLGYESIQLYSAESGLGSPLVSIEQLRSIIVELNIKSNSLVSNLNPSTEKLFHAEDIIVYDPNFFTEDLLTEMNHHKSNMLRLLDECFSNFLYAYKNFANRSLVLNKYETSKNFTITNSQNDVLFYIKDFKTALRHDFIRAIDDLRQTSRILEIVSIIIIFFALITFAIGSYGYHSRNYEFIYAYFRADYSNVIEEKQIQLSNLIQAIKSEDYETILEEPQNKSFAKKRSGKEKFILKNISFVKDTYHLKIALRSIFFLLLLIMNFILMIISAEAIITRIDRIPTINDDMTILSDLLNDAQFSLNEFALFVNDPSIIIKKQPLSVTLEQDLDSISQNTQKASHSLSTYLQKRLLENICETTFINNTVCRTSQSGIATRGILPTLIYLVSFTRDLYEAAGKVQTSSPQFLAIILESNAIEFYVILIKNMLTSFLETLVKDVSDQIPQFLDEGSSYVLVLIILGLFISFGFRMLSIFVVLPRMKQVRYNIFYLMRLMPAKFVVENRLIKEFLIKDSKELFAVLKKEVEL